MKKGLPCLSQLKSMWDEVQQYQPLSIELEVIKKREEEDMDFKLLISLDNKFESIKGAVLVM